MQILKLPNWALVNKFPAFYDLESLTAVEQTARLYGKVNELIDSYNGYVEEINKAINDFEFEKDKDVNDFIKAITCLTSNYINTVDMKIDHQNRAIGEVYDKYKNDVTNTIKQIISEMSDTGELDNTIYEALDNINTAVTNFIAQMNVLQSELEADYLSTKQNLESDYEAKKTALNSDYVVVKQNLEEDYETVKEDLNSTFTTYKESIDGSVSDFKDISDNKGVVLYDSAVDGVINDETVGNQINTNIIKYNTVSVTVAGYGVVNCSINVNSTGVTITGSGCGINNGDETLYILNVNLQLNDEFFVINNKTIILTILGSLSSNIVTDGTIKMNSGSISKIIGII